MQAAAVRPGATNGAEYPFDEHVVLPMRRCTARLGRREGTGNSETGDNEDRRSRDRPCDRRPVSSHECRRPKPGGPAGIGGREQPGLGRAERDELSHGLGDPVLRSAHQTSPQLCRVQRRGSRPERPGPCSART